MDPKKPTILFLASWYPVPSNPNHGIFIKNHALALSEYKQVILVYAYSSLTKDNDQIIKNNINKNFEEWTISYKKTIFFFPIISGLIKLIRFKASYKKLLNELILSNYSIKAIQLNTIFPAAMVLPLFKNKFKVPYTIVEHWSGYLSEDGNYRGFLLKYVTKKTISLAKKVFYVSEKQKLAMLENGLIGNYKLLYNVVDTTIFSPNTQLKSKKPMLLHVSSLIEREKNIKGTLRVLKKLQDNNQEIDFYFIGGTTELVNFYAEFSKELGLNNIYFLGEKTPIEVADYMKRAHALILFSHFEGMPVVVLESLASGLPVFSSNVGQLPYLIKESFGKLVTPGDEIKLTNLLSEFLQGHLNFNTDEMVEFINKNASYKVVGKYLNNCYTDFEDSSIN